MIFGRYIEAGPSASRRRLRRPGLAPPRRTASQPSPAEAQRRRVAGRAAAADKDDASRRAR